MRLSFIVLPAFAVVAQGCDKTDTEHCLLNEIDGATIVTTVEVTTTTGSRGTDSDIYLDIELDEGNDIQLYLDSAADDFEAGSVATYVVPVAPFAVGDVAGMDLRKDSSLFEGGDWRVNGLMVVFVDEDGGEWVAYDNPEVDELMTGDETEGLRCP